MQPLFQVIRALNPLAMKATHVLELQNYVLLNAWWKEKVSQLHISVTPLPEVFVSGIILNVLERKGK